MRSSPKVKTHINAGHNLLKTGQIEEAKNIFHLYPKEKSALYGLARSFFYEGKVDEALSLFKQVRILDPNHRPTYFRILECYKVKGDLNRALGEAAYCVEKFNDSFSHHDEIDLLYRSGNIDLSFEKHRLLIKKFPDYKEGRISFAIRLQEQNANDEAEKVLLQLMEDYPDFCGGYVAYAYFLERMYRLGEEVSIDDVEDAYLYAIQFSDAKAHYTYGIFLSDEKRFEDAEQQYRHALTIDSNCKEAKLGLACIYQAKKEFDFAERYAWEAIDAGPFWAPPYSVLGHIYKEKNIENFSGRNEELEIKASQFFLQAKELDPARLERHQDKLSSPKVGLYRESRIQKKNQHTSTFNIMPNVIVDERQKIREEVSYDEIRATITKLFELHKSIEFPITFKQRLNEAERKASQLKYGRALQKLELLKTDIEQFVNEYEYKQIIRFSNTLFENVEKLQKEILDLNPKFCLTEAQQKLLSEAQNDYASKKYQDVEFNLGTLSKQLENRKKREKKKKVQKQKAEATTAQEISLNSDANNHDSPTERMEIDETRHTNQIANEAALNFATTNYFLSFFRSVSTSITQSLKECEECIKGRQKKQN